MRDVGHGKIKLRRNLESRFHGNADFLLPLCKGVEGIYPIMRRKRHSLNCSINSQVVADNSVLAISVTLWFQSA